MIISCPFCHERVGQRAAVDCPACSRRMVRPCPYCAEDISVLAAACKYCGESVEPQPAQPPPVRRPSPVPAPVQPEIEIIEERVERPDIEFIDEKRPVPPPVGASNCVAWEDPSRGGRFCRWWSTWSASMFDMEGLWKRPAAKGPMAAVNYSWFLCVMMLLLALPVVALINVAAMADNAKPAELIAFNLGYLALFPLSWLAKLVSAYVGAALWHLPLRMLGAQGGFGTTVRAIGYGAGSAVWLMVPVLGPVISYVTWTASNYHAFKHGHKMSGGRAFIAAMLPTAVFVTVIAGVMALCIVTGQDHHHPGAIRVHSH